MATTQREVKDEEEDGWVLAKSTNKKKDISNKSVTNSVQLPSDEVGHPPLSKSALKNAKRRANKKKLTTSVSSTDHQLVGDDFNTWKERDKETTDKLYQNELKEALLLSLVDTSNDHTKEDNVVEEEKQQFESKSSSQQVKHSKKGKGVTISLQEFHKTDYTTPPVTTTSTTKSLITTSPSVSGTDVSLGPSCTDFFDKIESEVQTELQKENSKERIKASKHMSSHQSLHVAQLMDTIDKKDEMIHKLLLEHETLEAEMKEVKIRNQVLYKMLSKGEFSSKCELLEQIEQLTTDNTELSLEIERLNNELEKERSLNKSLNIELKKSQITKS